jgi:threonine dehydrogenase-like Zn-dependent dehydrogenase
MCEWIEVPAHKLHPSTTLDLDTLAVVEPLSIGAHAVRRGSIQSGDTTLVIGAGPIGLSVAAFARAAGARVAVADANEQRLAFCQTQFADVRPVPLPSDATIEAVRQALGEPPLVVFDATGNRASMDRAFELPAHGGTLVFVGLVQGTLTFADPEFHRRELTVLASRNALPSDFAHVIATLEAGRVDVRSWISHRAPLANVPDGFRDWTSPSSRVVKAIVEV